MELSERIFSVSEFIEILNVYFKKEDVRIAGEIAELKRASSGHVYFTIKDENIQDRGQCAVLDSIIWSRNYELCGINLEVGMDVVLTGHPNIYPPSGRLSFVADTVELIGEGALKKAYEALKAKLAAEGVFDPARKRPLPEFPRKIGVITSLKGAVIHDFENNLGKFGFLVNVCDSRVEGQVAIKDLMASVEAMRNIPDLDVLVIIRGGGSLESLQAFNNESLVRAIANFPVPVIAGIGHDKDVPLVALAADYMTSTPTAAAHLLSRPWEVALANINRLGSLFVRFQQELKHQVSNLDTIWSNLVDQTSRRMTWMAEQIDYAERFIRLNNPRRQLKLGYSITRLNGKILRSAKQGSVGEKIETEFTDGTIQSQIGY